MRSLYLMAILLVAGLVLFPVTAMAAGGETSGIPDEGIAGTDPDTDSAAEPVNATAEFRVYDCSEINVNTDRIPAGNYRARSWGGFSIINRPDATHTVLGNIRITLIGEKFTKPSYAEYAVWNSTYIRWVFPPRVVLPEQLDWKTDNQTLNANYHTSALTLVNNPVIIRRYVNRSFFVSDGFQFNSYEVRFVNNRFEDYSGRVAYEELEYSNSSILNERFTTDLPLTYLTNRSDLDLVTKKYESEMNFGFNNTSIQLNRPYHLNFTAAIDVRNNAGSPVRNFPRIFFGLNHWEPKVYSTKKSVPAIMPAHLLPPHVFSATAATNVSNEWQYSHQDQVKLAFNQTGTLVPDTVGVFRPSNRTFYQKKSTSNASIVFGQSTDLPLAGDWNGDGIWDVGVFRPSNHMFYLKIGSTINTISLGMSGDIPVTGDWNGDRKWDAGVFNRSLHRFQLRNGTTNTVISFGQSVDIPVAGDWNGDGLWDVGVFNSSTHRFLLRNGTGTTIVNLTVARPGDIPVTGDWNGDIVYEIGLYRPSNQTFYLKTGAKITPLKYGLPGDKPVIGKWG